MFSDDQTDGIAQGHFRPQGGAEPARTSIDGQLVRVLLNGLGEPPVRVTLWTGESFAPADANAVAHVRIASRASLLRLRVDPGYQFGECYSAARSRWTAIWSNCSKCCCAACPSMHR